jgi:hypothetical protein
VAPDDTFGMNGVAPGGYHLRVPSGEPPSFFAADNIILVEGSTPVVGFELELNFSAGSVNGRALDPDGNHITRTLVVLQSAEPGKPRDDRYRHVYPAAATGEFEIGGVAPGEYLLFACAAMLAKLAIPIFLRWQREKPERWQSRAAALFQKMLSNFQSDNIGREGGLLN